MCVCALYEEGGKREVDSNTNVIIHFFTNSREKEKVTNFW